MDIDFVNLEKPKASSRLRIKQELAEVDIDSFGKDFEFNGETYTLYDEQYQSALGILKELKDEKGKSEIRLAGLAGTGKTQVISYLLYHLGELGSSVGVSTYTWKASLVLGKRGVESTSIHSRFYKFDPPTQKFKKLLPSAVRSAYSFIVIDEASMLNKRMRTDILSYGVPILLVGDAGQLPPISNDKDDEFYMRDAEFKLTEVRRQALESPIIQLSMDIRNDVRIPYGRYGKGVFKIEEEELSEELLLKADIVICGKNNTRKNLNTNIRDLKGYDIDRMPAKGERIIMLNNFPSLGLFNGQFWFVEECYQDKYLTEGSKYYLLLKSEDGTRTITQKCAFPTDNFLADCKTSAQANFLCFEANISLVDFGHAITCHKSQGDSFKNVIVYEEWLGNREFHKRWMYTAVTRAEKGLIIIS